MVEALSKIFRFIVRNINFKIGWIGALLLGGFVYWINRKYGFNAAIVPAMKQFAYTFIVGGSLVRLSENISMSYDNRAKSIALAVLITTAITAILLTALHLMRGTPNPFYTIFWTTLTAPPGFFMVAVLRRRKYDREYVED